jgi:protoporphyrinogen oxidase
VRQFLSTGKLWTWKNGTQSIWEGVNDHLKHPAELNSTITAIRRTPEKVYITVSGGEEQAFDKLVICTPLELFLEYGDANQAEREFFS